jgi:hypothetical protein
MTLAMLGGALIVFVAGYFFGHALGYMRALEAPKARPRYRRVGRSE